MLMVYFGHFTVLLNENDNDDTSVYVHNMHRQNRFELSYTHTKRLWHWDRKKKLKAYRDTSNLHKNFVVGGIVTCMYHFCVTRFMSAFPGKCFFRNLLSFFFSLFIRIERSYQIGTKNHFYYRIHDFIHANWFFFFFRVVVFCSSSFQTAAKKKKEE